MFLLDVARFMTIISHAFADTFVLWKHSDTIARRNVFSQTSSFTLLVVYKLATTISSVSPTLHQTSFDKL